MLLSRSVATRKGLASVTRTVLVLSLIGSIGLQAVVVPTALAASAYSNAVLSDQPVAYWRLDETSGSIASDSSGHGNTGYLAAGVGLNIPSALAADADPDMSFNGAGWIQDNQPVFVGGDFTIEAWAKANIRDGEGTLVSLAGPSGQSRTLYLQAGRFLGMADDSNMWPAYTVVSNEVDPTRWHHVVFTTQGGNNLQIYVDGALSGSTTVGSRSDFAGLPWIGWSTLQWLPLFYGSIGDVALYPSTLSASRIQAHFAAASGAPVGPSNPPSPIPPVSTSNCSTSLQSLIDAAPAGGTVTAPGCVYRESVTINKPLTLNGQPGAEIRGSDQWTGWNQSGSSWVSQSSVPPLPVVSLDGSACDANTNNRCLWPEQVFFDGRSLAPVAPGTNPGAGQFALVNSGDRRIVLRDNPNGHTVEVTTRARWIMTGADGVTISGFTMRNAGNSAAAGAISNDGHSNWTLQNSTLSDAHTADVDINNANNVHVLNNDIGQAGLEGISGSAIGQGGVIQGNKIHNNGNAGFNRNWGVAGLKITNVQNFLIDSNESSYNDAMGLWCDIGCSNVTFTNNRVHHNQWQGLNYEISSGAKIHDNAFWENGWGFASYGWGAGIVISSSANAEVYNNTVAWNYAGISVISQNRPDSQGPNPVNINVHDNTIIKKTVTGDFSQTFWQNLSLAWLSDGTKPLYDPGSNNHGSNNHFYYDIPESQTVRYAWTGQYFTIAEFAATPGGAGSSYLSSSDANRALSSQSMPTSPEAH